MLQKLVYDFSSPGRGSPERNEEMKDLFYRGPGRSVRGCLRIRKGETVSFDTYFNMFSVLKWREYTALEDVALKLALSGRGNIRVCGVRLGDPGTEVTIGNVRYDGTDRAEKTVYRAKLRDLPDFLYFTIRAEENTELCGGGYDAAPANPNRVKIAVCICTYKREKALEENVRKIIGRIFEDASSPLHDCLDVYIADNGHTLKDVPFFADAAGTRGGRLFIFENKNCGGSAGFARCMIEAVLKKKAGYTHVLLMDDDARTEPFVLERTQSLLRALKTEYRDKFVGGARFALYRIRGKNGEESRSAPYILLNGAFRNIALRENAILNEQPRTLRCQAWFYCCIPVGHITESNLPLPCFIHYDDIEYGMRCGGAKGNQVIALNGICTEHPARAMGHPEYVGYYSGRNFLIYASEFSRDTAAGRLKTALKLLGRTLRPALRFDYGTAMYFLRGVRDFYEGIDAFRQRDAETLNAELRDGPRSRTAFQAAEEDLARLSPPFRRGPAVGEAGICLNWALPALRGRAWYDGDYPALWIDYFLRREIVCADPETGGAIAVRKDYGKLFGVIRAYFRLRRRVGARRGAVWSEWRERIGELQTLDFWETYLDLKRRTGMPQEEETS